MWGVALAQAVNPPAPPPAADGQWGTVAAWAAIAASLLWNVFNTWWVHRGTSKSKRTDFELEEYTTMFRQPLITALAEFEKFALDIQAVWRSNISLTNKKRKTATAFRRTYPDAMQKVSRILEQMDESPHVNGAAWVEELEDHAEAIDAQMNTISNDLNGIAARQGACDNLVGIVTTVKTKIEALAAAEARRIAGVK